MARNTQRGDAEMIKRELDYLKYQQFISNMMNLESDTNIVCISGLIGKTYEDVGLSSDNITEKLNNGDTLTASVYTREGDSYYVREITYNKQGVIDISSKELCEDLGGPAGIIRHSGIIGNVEETIKILNSYFKTDTYTEQYMSNYEYFLARKDELDKVEKEEELAHSEIDDIIDMWYNSDKKPNTIGEEELELDEIFYMTPEGAICNDLETYVRETLKSKELSEDALKYIIDYMTQMEKLKFLPEGVTIENLVERLLYGNLKNIVFFEEDHPINEEYGHNFRGYTAGENRKDAGTLYIRKSLPDAEIVFYHELTHQLQKQKDGMTDGLSYVDEVENVRLGNLGDEVQVQTTADMVYASKYRISLSKSKYKSEDMRMLPRIRDRK